MLNLVKKKEKKPRETLLLQELESIVVYLNTIVDEQVHRVILFFGLGLPSYLNILVQIRKGVLPEGRRLRLFSWDMAECQKSKTEKVFSFGSFSPVTYHLPYHHTITAILTI